MTLYPLSLLWRTFLLLALLVVLTTAAWFGIFRAYEAEPRARQMAQNVVSVVNLTRAALVNAQPEKRRELLLEMSASEGIQVYPAEPGEKIVESDEPFENLMKDAVRDQLGPDTRFAAQRDGRPGFWVSFDIEDDEYWMRIPRERIERQIALQWLGWGALALVFSLMAAYFIVSRISRPLRALSSAARLIGQGRTPEPVPEAGPQEIRTLTRAFNRMSSDLARLDADRALILAGVSHDLRTPLARLRLGVEMSGGDAQLRDGMTADIEEMDRIVSQFLDFARSDGGEAPQRMRLDELAAQALEHYSRRGAAIEAQIKPTARLPLQPLAMRRVVLNLIDNALRYGSGPITLNVRNLSGGAVLEVLDRGPGIPPDQVGRLKQPFTRLERARGDGGGAGLGLAIIDRVVRQHRGTLDLLPREGGGLIARITLPAR